MGGHVTDHVLDNDEIRMLARRGWSLNGLAQHYGVHLRTIKLAMAEVDYDPTLRARWEARLPAMRVALRADIAENA